MCDGSGLIDVMESVYNDEPHQAYVGTKRCLHIIDDNWEPDDL